MGNRLQRALLALLVVPGACTESGDGEERQVPEPASALTKPDQLCRTTSGERPCRKPAEVEAWLADPALEILGADEPPAGIQGVIVLTLRVPRPTPIVFRAKWRAQYTTTSRNSPRRELAAYAVQKLFLEPGEYVVPPAAAHCFPLAEYNKMVSHRAKATFPEAPCVYGILSYWLEDVQSLADAREAGWFHGQYRHAFDPQLFAANTAYRDSIGRVNMLTYVIGHADSHAKNFVITTDSAAPLVYSVDNSLSLGLRKNHKLSRTHDWSELKVPALPEPAIGRLRKSVDRLDELAVVAALAPKDGSLVAVETTRGEPSESGMEWVDGKLRVGLSASEIGDIKVRVALLLQWVRQGAIRLYGDDE